jgi:hypothetical protein
MENSGGVYLVDNQQIYIVSILDILFAHLNVNKHILNC